MTLVFDMSVLGDIENDIIQRGNQTLDEIYQLADDFVPVGQTGDLKGAISILKRFSPGSLFGEVGVIGVYYAPFVHFGTKHASAQPFLHRAFDAAAPRFLEGLGRSVQLRLSAQSYLTRPAPRQFTDYPELQRPGGSFTYLLPGQSQPPEIRSINFIPITSDRVLGPFSQ